MKVLAITLKDLKHSFRSLFGLMFMFGIPLLLTGVFAFAFGGSSDSESEMMEITPAMVGIVDDAQNEESAQLIGLLSGEDLKKVVNIHLESGFADAEERLANGYVDVVLQIPEEDSMKKINLYAKNANADNVKTVENLVMSMADTMDIQKIMVDQLQAGTFLPQNTELLFSAPNIHWGEQTTADSIPDNLISSIVSNIMGAMMIFFAFFSGAFGAQSILTEEEQGTLQRLFTTGNSRQKILAGKFLAVWIMLVVQIASLLFVSGWIFDIQWGNPGGQFLLALGIGTAAAGFGILLLSFLRDMRSAGLVFSGAVMVTGFVGLGAVFTGSGELSIQALFVPQGWALKGLWALQSADVNGWVLSTAALLAWGLVLFVVGKIRFDRRYMREV